MAIPSSTETKPQELRLEDYITCLIKAVELTAEIHPYHQTQATGKDVGEPGAAVQELFGVPSQSSFQDPFQYFGCETLDEFLSYIDKICPTEEERASFRNRLNTNTLKRFLDEQYGSSLADSREFQNAFFAATMIQLNTMWAQKLAEQEYVKRRAVSGVPDYHALLAGLHTDRGETQYDANLSSVSGIQLWGSRDYQEDRFTKALTSSALPPHLLLQQITDCMHHATADMGMGSTGAWVHISRNGNITAANVGDSLIAVYLRNRETGKVQSACLSRKHSLADPFEEVRVFSAKEFQALQLNRRTWKNMGKIPLHNGLLSMSRAFGDGKVVNSYISDQPDTAQIKCAQTLQTQDVFVLVASDGLSEKFDPLELGNLLEKALQDCPADQVREMASVFFKCVASRAACSSESDNTTVQWICLQSLPKQDLIMGVFDGHGGGKQDHQGRIIIVDGGECAEKLAQLTRDLARMTDQERRQCSSIGVSTPVMAQGTVPMPTPTAKTDFSKGR